MELLSACGFRATASHMLGACSSFGTLLANLESGGGICPASSANATPIASAVAAASLPRTSSAGTEAKGGREGVVIDLGIGASCR
eukprot:CAMPEP_0177248836 /NCGR_PEP_ID=MMETSP0367-20130122/52409_1 /TAXON_ID=447022 ORGANISM="Scrippsiella hangoei-like, Strain SHHI-4" /NCGR_SAMPLE_ID=MMETSP0367 /ASSEMBLY_ACC=CAM_ASM_000362 /LENGTH=84 /DNA_ID=CAMNT_0018701257 /DNA_START=148 /DNA_END=398 /DNA_ORIENTATION=-